MIAHINETKKLRNDIANIGLIYPISLSIYTFTIPFIVIAIISHVIEEKVNVFIKISLPSNKCNLCKIISSEIIKEQA
jgi:hypothetical protein